MAIDRVLDRDRLGRRIEMRDDLMPEQVEVDPVIARPPLGTAQHLAIEMAGGGQVVDRKGKVERTQGHGRKLGWRGEFFYIRFRELPLHHAAHSLPPQAQLGEEWSAKILPSLAWGGGPPGKAGWWRGITPHPALLLSQARAISCRRDPLSRSYRPDRRGVAACGFAPLDLWPLLLIGLIVLLALVQDAPSIRSALSRGWAFGVGHFTVNNNWFQHAFDFQDKMPPVLGYFAAVGLALYLAIFPMAAAGVAWRLRGRRPDVPYVLIFGAAWIVTEYLRARLFTGYAWDPISVAWLPVIGVARMSAFVGTYALSGLTVALAGAIWLALRRHWHLAAVMVPATGLAALSAPLTRAPEPAADAPLVRVVQPMSARTSAGRATGLYSSNG